MDLFNEIVELYVYLDLTESCGIAKMPTLKPPFTTDMPIHLSPKNPGNYIPRPRITIQSNPILEFGSLKILGRSLD